MIKQISIDIEVPDEEYDDFDTDEFIAEMIESNSDLVVYGCSTTAVWANEEDYCKNKQL